MKRKAGEAFSGVDSQEEPGVQIGETFLLDAKDAAEEGNYIRGSTVLPVAEALPDDGIPTDGLEFLLMVRYATVCVFNCRA